MSTPALTARALSAFLLLAACSKEEAKAPPPPPPLPVAPATPVAPEPAAPVAEPGADQAPAEKPDRNDEAPSDEAPIADKAGEDKPAKVAAKPGASLYDLEKAGQAKVPKPPPAPVETPKPTKPVAGTVTKPEPTIPSPGGITKPEPKPPAPKAGKLTVPSTDNVKVEVPKGLQAALEADGRMQTFVNQVVKIADGCYASERKMNPNAEGVLEVRITLHSEARPDAQPKAPSALNGLLVCGMGKLMNVKMPFFTGKEGEKHTVKIRFTR